MVYELSNFGSLFEDGLEREIKTVFMRSTEAEAVKLFANTYLAMRVAFFNEMILCSSSCARYKSIINGMCLDERIGDGIIIHLWVRAAAFRILNSPCELWQCA